MGRIIGQGYAFTYQELPSVKIEQLGLDESVKKAFWLAQSWLQHQSTYQLQSSGSTGKPKQLSFEREQIKQSAQQTVDQFNLKKEDCLLCCLSVDYVAGFMMVMRAVSQDMNLWVVPPSGNPLEALTSSHAFDFAAMVPLQLATILNKANDQEMKHMNQAKAVILGGAPVNQKLIQQTQHLTTQVHQTYGMTETLTHVAVRHLNGQEDRPPFQALKGVEFEQDERGCLIIHSPIVDEPIVTNDLAELIDPHTFYWQGRYDNVINSGGYKVQIEKVEQALEAVIAKYWPGTSYVISSIPDEALGNQVILAIEGAEVDDVTKQEFLTATNKVLHPYEKPKDIFNLTELPKTETGKVKRRAVQQLLQS